MKKKRSYISLLILILAHNIAFLGCDDTEDHEVVQDEHVCEHLTDTASVALQAVANAQTAIDSLSGDVNYRIQTQDHIRFDLSLIQDSTSLYYGYVPYMPIDGDGDYILYLDKEAHVELVNVTESTTVAPEEEMDHSDYCDAIHYMGIYELHAEDTYLLSFYEIMDPSIGVVFVKVEDHEGHDH